MKISKGIICLLTCAAAENRIAKFMDSNVILHHGNEHDFEGHPTRLENSVTVSRNLTESSEVHSGEYFDDAFYENECYKIDKYSNYICVKWVESSLYMVAQNELDVFREGANVVSWSNEQVVKLLNWEQSAMTWDGTDTTHQTRMLDSSNIRVLDQPGYYYIKRVVATKNSGFIMNSLFANFALSEGGMNNPSFAMCPSGNSPHVEDVNNSPMCCKGSHEASEWSCTNDIEIKNYYANSCIFPINDCTDTLQDCIPREQICMQMIPAKEEDQCEAMSDSLCIEAGVSKWMWMGEDFSGSNSPKSYFPAGARSDMTFDHFFPDSEIESGNYRCSWLFSPTDEDGGEDTSPTTDIMRLSITKNGISSPDDVFFSKTVTWSEMNNGITMLESDFNIPPNSGMVKLQYDVTVFGPKGVNFDLVKLEKLPVSPPTPAPTAIGWESVSNAGGTYFDSLSVSAAGKVYAVGTNKRIYWRDSNKGRWSLDGFSSSSLVVISADGNTLLSLGLDSFIYSRKVGTAWSKLSNSGTLFDQFVMNEDASEMYTVNTNKKDLYSRNGLNDSSWASIKGKVSAVALSGDGNHLWAWQKNRKRNNVLYKGGQTWKRVTTPCQFLSMAVTRTGMHVWGVCPTAGEVYYRNGFSGDWEQVYFSGSALAVDVSAGGEHVWLINSDKKVYYRREYEYLDSTPQYQDQTPGGSAQSCKGVRDRNLLQFDGMKKLRHASSGKYFNVYCSDMDDDSPNDWLSLTGENYGSFASGGSSPGSTVTTTYSKIRINPLNFNVDVHDTTYATSTGHLVQGDKSVTSMPYGVAMSCRGSNDRSGVGKFDLSATDFDISSNQVFKTDGWKAAGGLHWTNGKYKGWVDGGGYCGWSSFGAQYNPTNTEGPSWKLWLELR